MTVLPPLRRSAADAEAYARVVHAGQVDKAGRPYVEHLERVANKAAWLAHSRDFDVSWQELDAIRQIAWLHDAIEDTPNGGKGLAIEGFSTKVIRAVEMLSKPKRSSQPYGEWIAWLIENASLPVLLVKLADMEDNADPARLALLPAETRARLERKYGPEIAMVRAAIADRGNLS